MQVYISRWTPQPGSTKKGRFRNRPANVHYFDESRPLSTLETLATSGKMVLLGDPCGGKSTFVNHLSPCLAGHILNPNKGWLVHLPKWPQNMANLLPIPAAFRSLAAWARATGAERKKSKLLLDFCNIGLERGIWAIVSPCSKPPCAGEGDPPTRRAG